LIAEPVAVVDWLRIAHLVGIYRDLPLGAVDASVVAAAERLRLTQVATLDRRHFTVVRPAHIEAFELLP
jgi:predicted nucleic acid-binding protein